MSQPTWILPERKYLVACFLAVTRIPFNNLSLSAYSSSRTDPRVSKVTIGAMAFYPSKLIVFLSIYIRRAYVWGGWLASGWKTMMLGYSVEDENAGAEIDQAEPQYATGCVEAKLV